MSCKDFKTSGDAIYDYITDFGRKDMTQNYIKNLENELKVVKEDREEIKEANMKLLASFMRILDMNNVEDIKNEVSKTTKETKDILLKEIK